MIHGIFSISFMELQRQIEEADLFQRDLQFGLRITFHTCNGKNVFPENTLILLFHCVHWTKSSGVFLKDFILLTDFKTQFSRKLSFIWVIIITHNFVHIAPAGKFMFKVNHKGTTTTSMDAVLVFLLLNINKKQDARKLVNR